MNDWRIYNRNEKSKCHCLLQENEHSRFFKELRKTEIVDIRTTGTLISRSKRQNPAFLRVSSTASVKCIGIEVATVCSVPSRPPARLFLKDTGPDQETIAGTPTGKGAEGRGVGWEPSAGDERPKSCKVLLFLCRVPYESKCSWPAKKR